MIMNLYSINDSTAGEYGQPAPMNNDAVAVRSFGTLVNEKGTIMNTKPSDFSIWKVGTFDTETGTILPIQPEKLANGDSLVQEE